MSGYSTPLRNAKLDAITTFVGSAGFLRIYDGTRPATGGTATTKLAEFTLGSPFAPGAASFVLSPTLPSATTGITNGTATWARVVKADGTTHVMDLSLGTSGTQVVVNTVTITTGIAVSVTSWTFTDTN